MNSKLFYQQNKIIFFGILCGSMGCTSDKLPAPLSCNDFAVPDILNVKPADCGLSTGGFEVGTNTDDFLEFSIDGASFQQDKEFNNLAAGNYTLTVRNLEGCEVNTQVNITNAEGLNIAIEVLDTDCGSNNGRITVTPTQGVDPVQYKIDDGTFQSESVFDGLPSGQYTILAKDASGCEVGQAVEISSEAGYESVIKPIFEKDCISSSCHGGAVSPDLRNLTNAQARASAIKARTGNRTMPPGHTLTDEEIEQIACWVDDGAKDN